MLPTRIHYIENNGEIFQLDRSTSLTREHTDSKYTRRTRHGWRYSTVSSFMTCNLPLAFNLTSRKNNGEWNFLRSRCNRAQVILIAEWHEHTTLNTWMSTHACHMRQCLNYSSFLHVCQFLFLSFTFRLRKVARGESVI